MLPINLGRARVQFSEHTFIHYYDLEPLVKEVSKLNSQHNGLIAALGNKVHLVDNYLKISVFLRKNINSKLFYLNHTLKAPKLHRNRRGLINGIGSIIKGITGNMDSQDERKIFKILDHLKVNQNNLQSQLNMQYSVSNGLIDNFNRSIESIKHNEDLLATRITQLKATVDANSRNVEALHYKDLFNQLIILYNNILSVLKDIEDSLTFCKLRTLHPSIIKSVDLFSEISKISDHYKNQLPFEVNYENIINFESSIKINCKVEKMVIIYFLELPIDLEENFELYHMLPIPTRFESAYRTIIPKAAYVLKSESNKVRPLSDICTGTTVFQCPNHLLLSYDLLCEEEILSRRSSTNCEYAIVHVNQSYYEMIPEINQYLLIFPEAKPVTTQCNGESDTKQLKGIYLLKDEKCSTTIGKQEISYSDKTYGSAMVIAHETLQIKEYQNSNITIDLTDYKLQDISLPHVQKLIPNKIQTYKEDYKYHLPSVWTIVLYLTITAIISVKCWRKKQLRKKGKCGQGKEEKTFEDQVNLPGEASF